MNELNYYQIISLILQAINLFLIFLGWIILNKQNRDIEKRKNNFDIEFSRIKWEKEYIDQQVSLLYGPISQLLKEQNIRFRRVLEMLGRSSVFPNNLYKLSDLSEGDQRIWVHFVKTYKIPVDNQIVELLRKNRHLVFEAEKNANAINAFLDYAVGWELLDNQSKKDVPNYYEYYYCYNFPKNFADYIYTVLTQLQNRQKELLNMQNKLLNGLKK